MAETIGIILLTFFAFVSGVCVGMYSTVVNVVNQAKNNIDDEEEIDE